MSEQESTGQPRRRSIVMLQDLDPGTKIGLRSGATAEVADNPRDGAWIYVRYLSSPDIGQVGAEDLVFAEEVVEVLSA